MSALSSVRCQTPRCAGEVAKYGENYHAVYDLEAPDGATQLCKRCGGRLIDGVWQHKCKACGTHVAPGALVGLFVPHACSACKQKQREEERRQGAVCSACGKAYVDCYC